MADLEQVVNDLNLASQSLQELREKYDGALDLLDNKNTEITGALENAKSNVLQEVQTASDTATSQISQLKDTSLNLVNEAKNTAIEEVNNAVSGIDTSKEEALLEIEQAKTAQEEKITALEQAKKSIITELSEKAKLLTQNLEWTVANETQLREAINEALKFKKADILSTITIKLTADIVLSNSLRFDYVDCRNIIIDGQSQFKIQKNTINNLDPILYGGYSAFLPFFRKIEISHIETQKEKGKGLVLFHSSQIDLHASAVTFKNLNIGIDLAGCSIANCRNLIVDNCNIGIHGYRGSLIDAGLATIKNCEIGIKAIIGNNLISANSAIFENNTTNCNIPFNQVTSDGIIFN